MKVVSQRTIQQTLASMDKMGEKQVEALIKSFVDEQPIVMGLLMSQQDDYSDADFDNLIDLTLILFLSFKKECGKMRQLSMEEVESIHERHLDNLERMEELSDADLEAETYAAMDNAKQPFLLSFVTEELISMEEAGALDDEDGAAAFFTVIQLMIELFDAAANGSFLRIV